MNWLSLVAEEQLTEVNLLSQKSEIKAIILFKHSTRCSTSSMVLNRLERFWKLSEKDVPTYFLDLMKYRNVSDKIEQLYGVSHESPQVLLIKNGKCIYSASHSDISVPDIESAINS